MDINYCINCTSEFRMRPVEGNYFDSEQFCTANCHRQYIKMSGEERKSHYAEYLRWCKQFACRDC